MAKHEESGNLPTDYNMKVGPILLNMDASLEGDTADLLEIEGLAGSP